MIEATPFTPWAALTGGALIGLSAVLLMASLGRIAGVSGILGQAAFGGGPERTWRMSFLAGLLVAAWATFRFVEPAWFAPRTGYPIALLLVGGLLVAEASKSPRSEVPRTCRRHPGRRSSSSTP